MSATILMGVTAAVRAGRECLYKLSPLPLFLFSLARTIVSTVHSGSWSRLGNGQFDWNDCEKLIFSDSLYLAMQALLQTTSRHLGHWLMDEGGVRRRHTTQHGGDLENLENGSMFTVYSRDVLNNHLAHGPVTAAPALSTSSPLAMSLVATSPRPAPGTSTTRYTGSSITIVSV